MDAHNCVQDAHEISGKTKRAEKATLCDKDSSRHSGEAQLKAMPQLVLQLVLMLVLQLVEQLAELLCISPFPSIKTEHKTLYDHTEIIKPCITGLISSVLARMVVGMVATKQTLCRELTSDTVLMRAELKADEKWTFHLLLVLLL